MELKKAFANFAKAFLILNLSLVYLASQVPHSHGPPVQAHTPSLPGQVQPGSLLEQPHTEQRTAPMIINFFISSSLFFHNLKLRHTKSKFLGQLY